MSQRFEVLDKNVTEVKLTIAKDRVTLKIPPGVSDEERGSLIDYAEDVQAAVGIPKFTLRGIIQRNDADTAYFVSWKKGKYPNV